LQYIEVKVRICDSHLFTLECEIPSTRSLTKINMTFVKPNHDHEHENIKINIPYKGESVVQWLYIHAFSIWFSFQKELSLCKTPWFSLTQSLCFLKSKRSLVSLWPSNIHKMLSVRSSSSQLSLLSCWKEKPLFCLSTTFLPCKCW
jgi:hypothetical protein